MKRALSFIGALLMTASVLVVPVYAMVKSDDTVIVGVDEVINDDFFAAGNEVIIEGTINGDVYVGASRLSVRGTVNGDVIAGANNIEITGVIRDDLRVGGNNISLIGAEIGDSVSVAGNELSIDADSTVGGGLLFGGRSLSIYGSVGRGIMMGGQTSRVDGPVGSTVRVAAETITIGENAIVEGNLEYRSDEEATIDGEIKGEIIRAEGGVDISTEGFMRWFVVGFNTWAFLAAAIIGGVLMLLFPNMFKKSHEKFTKRPWSTIGWGALIFLATGPAALLLMLTLVGVPMALIVLILWGLAVYFAKFFVGYSVGHWIFKSLWRKDKQFKPNQYLLLIVGLALYYLLRIIPTFGILVRFGVTIVGLGLLLALYERPKTAKK